MTESVLGVDLGTSALRAVVVSVKGSVTSSESFPYPTRRPRPEIAEQDPENWWSAFENAAGQLAVNHPRAWKSVRAVAVTGQSPGVVLVDADGTSIRPAITWEDSRAIDQAGVLAAAATEAQWLEWTGYPHGYDASLRPAKLRWLVDNEPDCIDRTRWVLQPKDFLVHRLTGRAVIDYISQTGSGLSHAPGGLWDLIGIPVETLPEPIAPMDVAGEVVAGSSLASLVGLPVFPGTFDGLCGVVGTGPHGVGQVVNVAGTSQIVELIIDAPRPVEGLKVLPLGGGLSMLGGPTQTGGRSVDLAMRQLGFADWQELEHEAAHAPRGSGGLIHLPFLAGERTPYWDLSLRGAFVGLSASHDRAHLARSVIEATALVVADIVDRAREANPTPLDVVMMSGGMARSGLCAVARADLVGAPVRTPQVVDASAVGAAIMGATGLGWFSDPLAAAAKMVRTHEVATPEAGFDATEMLDRYRAAVAAASQLPS